MENIQNAIDKYIQSIIQISFDNLPAKDNYIKYDIEVAAVRKMIIITAHYYTADEKRISFNPKYPSNNDRNTDLSFLFLDLRDAMYQLSPNNGAWFECTIEVKNDGTFSTTFNYDEKPNFKYIPSKEKFIDDLKTYPRATDSIPNWLKLAIEGKLK